MIRETTKKNTQSTIPITIHIKVAFAQLALLGFVPPEKAQTNNSIRLTKGITKRSMVTNQSPVVTGGAGGV